MSNIHAGTGANNVIPGELVIDFNFRFSTESRPEACSLVWKRCTAPPRPGIHHRLDPGGRPFLTRRGPLVDALRPPLPM